MMHVLIIEDDPNSLVVMEQALLRNGIASTSVQDPTMINDVLKAHNQFDIVLLDLEMPEIDGYRMFDILRHDLNITAPIAACTVHHNEMEQVREMGFNGFLGKPIQMDKLTEQLTRIINGEDVWEAN